MAKLCMFRRNDRRLAKFKQFKTKRDDARKVVSDPDVSFEDKLIAQKYLQKTKDGCRTRIRRICTITGRSRGVYRKFALARSELRKRAMNHMDVPGLTKSSW